MADIRKRTGKKGTNYQVRYPSKSAASGYTYATFDTLKEARAFTENLGTLQDMPEKRLRVSEAVTKWLEICEKIGRDGREAVEFTTLVEYQRRAKVMKVYAWNKYIHELMPADIVAFRNWLLGEAGISRDLARRTLSSFHSVLIEAKRQGFIVDDPAAGITIRADGRHEEDSREVRIPTDDEVRALLAAADRLAAEPGRIGVVWRRYRPMIYLAVFTGLRPSEYRGLAWTSIAEDRISVRQRADRLNSLGPVKSRAGRRTIFVPAAVSTILSEWKRWCPPSDLGLVFPTAQGTPMSLSNFTRRCWEPLLKEAGLIAAHVATGAPRPKYTPYALRHYFASKLIEKGSDLKFIQTVMGHADVQMTLNVYGHLLRGRDAEHKTRAEAFASDLLAS